MLPASSSAEISPSGDRSAIDGPPVVGARMRPVLDRLSAFARLSETLLLTGPTGVGKSRLARWVHGVSARSAAPFVTVDLLGVPADMQLAELFGWKKGAFTGAVSDRPGAVTRAANGTLFIDEIDKLSRACQAGLLRLLEERQYRVLGDGRDDLLCRARIVVGTNVDLGAAVDAGAFRSDLYFRLNVLVAEIPALDERRDEIEGWARFMTARRHTEARGQGPATLADAAAHILAEAPWPGNLRQLDNVVRRAWALAYAERATSIAAPVVRLALAQESRPTRTTVIELLERAARLLVEEQLRRSSTGRLHLQDLDVFRGFVLESASRRLELRDAIALFGGESTVSHRNYTRAFRRARDAAVGLRAWFHDAGKAAASAPDAAASRMDAHRDGPVGIVPDFQPDVAGTNIAF